MRALALLTALVLVVLLWPRRRDDWYPDPNYLAWRDALEVDVV